MNPTDRPQNPTELGLAGGSPPEADRRAADREPAMGAWPVRESRGVHARCLRGCRRTDPGPRNAMCGHSDLVRSKNRASGARTRRRHPNGKELKHGKCLDDTTHARAIANLEAPSSPIFTLRWVLGILHMRPPLLIEFKGIAHSIRIRPRSLSNLQTAL